MPSESSFTHEWKVETPPRRDLGCEPNGPTVPDPAFVTLGLEHVSVELVV